MEDPKNQTPPSNTPNNDGTQEDKTKGGAEDKGTPKTFTQEDLDRIAAKTREEEKKKAEKALEAAKAAAREEALAEAKLSEEERAKKDREKKEKEDAERELNITLRENKADAKEKFAELKLPMSLVEFVVGADKEAMTAKITSLKEAWDAAIKEEVATQLKGNPPKDVKTGTDKGGDSTIEPTNFI